MQNISRVYDRSPRHHSCVFTVNWDLFFKWIRFADFEPVNGRWNTLLPWSKYMYFRVGSRSPVTFETELFGATVNNSFQPLPNFCHKELHPRCCIGPELNIVTRSTKILTGIRGHHRTWFGENTKYLPS